jgi:hypothetical protein
MSGGMICLLLSMADHISSRGLTLVRNATIYWFLFWPAQQSRVQYNMFYISWRGVYILSLCIEILIFVIYVDGPFWLLIGEMLGGFMGKRKGQADIQPDGQPSQHWPIVMPKKKTCKLCSQNKIRSEPKSGCGQCWVNLCVKYFQPYHRQKFPVLFV